jgi:hypothetical protein
MKALRIHSLVWALSLTVLVCAAASADVLHFYVGFTGIQTQDASGGKNRYVDMQVGSNESQSNAKGYMIFFQLGVKDANGAIVCNTGKEFITTVRPAIRPLRFQVFYPTSLRQPLKLATKKYTLFGKIEVREGGTSNLLATEQNQYAVDFPVGGTPSCKILMTQGQ